MESFPSRKRLSFLQKKSQESIEKARLSSGLERLRYFAAAFPYAVNGSVPGNHLNISWNAAHRAFNISDWKGFITLVDAEQLALLAQAESKARGSVRAWVEGRSLEKPPVPKTLAKPTVKIKLSDLNINPEDLQ